jgi:hypothetical protein
MDPLPRIIGLSGKFGSGKTTFCSHFLSAHPIYTKESFAENLRKVVALMINRDVEFIRTAEGKNTFLPNWGFTIGELLQKIGTDGIRNILPDAWVLSLFERFENDSFWIIDDVRFPNEADAIRAVGGIVVRFEGDPGKCYERLSETRDPLHASETALDDYKHFHCVVQTEKFVNQLDKLYNHIFQ